MKATQSSKPYNWNTERGIIYRRVVAMLGTDLAILLTFAKADPKAYTRIDWMIVVCVTCALPFLVEAFYTVERRPEDADLRPRDAVLVAISMGVGLLLTLLGLFGIVFKISPLLAVAIVTISMACIIARTLLRVDQ